MPENSLPIVKDSPQDPQAVLPLSEYPDKSVAYPHDRSQFDWVGHGLHYFSYSYYLRQIFGYRVQRVSVDAGFTCPNVDGTVAVGAVSYTHLTLPTKA